MAALGVGLLALFAQPLVLLVFGSSFEGSVVVLEILLWGYLATLVTLPGTMLLLGMNQPQLYMLVSIVGLLTWLCSAWVLIPGHGSEGAAWATLAARAANAVATVGFVWLALRYRSTSEGG